MWKAPQLTPLCCFPGSQISSRKYRGLLSARCVYVCACACTELVNRGTMMYQKCPILSSDDFLHWYMLRFSGTICFLPGAPPKFWQPKCLHTLPVSPGRKGVGLVPNAYAIASFIEMTILSSLSCGGTFVRNQHTYCLLIYIPIPHAAQDGVRVLNVA